MIHILYAFIVFTHQCLVTEIVISFILKNASTQRAQIRRII